MPIIPQKAIKKANIIRRFLEKQSLDHNQA